MGCALAAAVAAGKIASFREIKGAVRVRRSFEPRRDCRAAYDELYHAFRRIYPGLCGVCASLNAGVTS
jgi:sugar (pentulose or hexulose) kinase